MQKIINKQDYSLHLNQLLTTAVKQYLIQQSKKKRRHKRKKKIKTPKQSHFRQQFWIRRKSHIHETPTERTFYKKKSISGETHWNLKQLQQLSKVKIYGAPTCTFCIIYMKLRKTLAWTGMKRGLRVTGHIDIRNLNRIYFSSTNIPTLLNEYVWWEDNPVQNRF